MKQRRDLIILIGLFLVLVVFTILGPGQSRDTSLGSTPTTHSSAPGGALALLRWMQDMGYDARRLEYTAFELDEDTAALVILNPTEPFNRTQADMVLDWVEQGGVLILSHEMTWFFGGGNALMQELDVDVEGYNEDLDTIERAPVMQPVFHTPPLDDVLVRTGYVLTTERDDVVSLVGLPDDSFATPGEGESEGEEEGEEDAASGKGYIRSVLAGIKHGQGYMYISSAVFPFTNDGLRDSNNAALVLNILRRVPPGGRILFDEWHHGFFSPPSLRSVVLGSAWGQAIVYALVVFALYLVLTGRRFGKPVPFREETARRSSAEYVENMADLYQRGRKRAFIVRHIHTSFKRHIARPFGINPHLDVEDFVTELARYREVDEQRLLALLKRMRRTDVSEDELLRIASERDAILQEMLSRR
jgi:hypothetical protein